MSSKCFRPVTVTPKKSRNGLSPLQETIRNVFRRKKNTMFFSKQKNTYSLIQLSPESGLKTSRKEDSNARRKSKSCKNSRPRKSLKRWNKALLESKKNYKFPKTQPTKISKNKPQNKLLFRQARPSQASHLLKKVGSSKIFSESEPRRRNPRKKKSRHMSNTLATLTRRIRKRRKTLLFYLAWTPRKVNQSRPLKPH